MSFSHSLTGTGIYENSEDHLLQLPENVEKITIRIMGLDKNTDASAWNTIVHTYQNYGVSGAYALHDGWLFSSRPRIGIDGGGPSHSNMTYVNPYSGMWAFHDYIASLTSEDGSDHFDICIYKEANKIHFKLLTTNGDVFLHNYGTSDVQYPIWGFEENRRLQMFTQPQEGSNSRPWYPELKIDTDGKMIPHPLFSEPTSKPIYVSFGDVTPGPGTYEAGLSGSTESNGAGGEAPSAEATQADNEIAELDNSDLVTLKGAAKSFIEAKTFDGADEAEKRGKRKRYLKQFMKKMRELRAESDGKLVLDNGLPGSAFQKKTTIIEVKQNPTDGDAEVIPSGEMVYVPIEDGDTAKWKRGGDVHTLTNVGEVYTLNITSGGTTTEIFSDGAAGQTRNYSSNGVDYNLELGGGGENDAGGSSGGSGDPFITPMFELIH
jgi:hypothetical protein